MTFLLPEQAFTVLELRAPEGAVNDPCCVAVPRPETVIDDRSSKSLAAVGSVTNWFAGVGVGVGVGSGVGIGSGVGVGIGFGLGVGIGSGSGVGAGAAGVTLTLVDSVLVPAVLMARSLTW